MRDSPPVAFYLRPLHAVGAHVLGPRWQAFLDGLGSVFRGTRDPEGRAGLLAARFGDLSAAWQAWHDAVKAAGPPVHPPTHPWPVQVLLDVGAGDRPPPPDDDPRWDALHPGRLHLTAALHVRWEALGGGRLPASPEPVADGLYGLGAPLPEQTGLHLLPSRHLAVGTGERECFYCGSRAHRPSHCPSRALGPEDHMLSALAEERLEQIASDHRAAFAQGGPPDLAAFAGDLSPRDPVHRGAVAFFDGKRVYQLRFLSYLAYSEVRVWPGPEALGAARPPRANALHLGLDCLRVGRRGQAVEYLRATSGMDETQRFFAALGQALAATEAEEVGEAARLFSGAAQLASPGVQRAYANLLRARLHEVEGAPADALRILEGMSEGMGTGFDVAFHALRVRARLEGVPVDWEWFRAGVREYPEHWVRLLLEPGLGRLAGAADGILASALESARRKAESAVGQAAAECTALSEWLGDEASGLPPLTAALRGLQGRLERGGYRGWVQVAAGADRILSTSHILRARAMTELRDGWKAAGATWLALGKLWERYPYKGLFRGFGPALQELGAKVREAEALLAEDSAQACRRAARLLRDAQPELRRLQGQVPDLTWLEWALRCARAFGVRLLWAEALAVPVAFGAPALLALALPGAADALRGFWVVFLVGLLAPGVAAAGALRATWAPPATRQTGA
ncbi:MAG: hypothetical protein AB1578_19055 [Thermodesulfobacteriota bacterium]